MEAGNHLVRIKDYGVSVSKSGSMNVFIEVTKNGESMRWFGSPMKRDGTPNEMCLLQLAACGFDPSSDSIEDLNKGLDSGLLVIDEDVECQVGPETSPTGDIVLRMKWIGAAPRKTLSTEEVKALITDEQRAALKTVSGKFKVRKKSVKQNPDETIPF